MKLQFTVLGTPISKGRHQTVALKRCLKCHRTQTGWPCKYCGHEQLEFVSNIPMTPKTTQVYENMVAMTCREKMNGGEKLSGPVELSVIAWMPIPKSRLKKLEEAAPHCQRPDADNILKAICDGLNRVAWTDDCTVYKKSIEKRWTHLEPRAEIIIQEHEVERSDTSATL